MSRNLAIGTVALILIAAGFASGKLTNRWAAANELLIEKKLTLPVSIGAWDSREDAVDARVLKVSQASAIERRWYVNRNTGAVLSVSLVYGAAGPVSVHTPDICYKGSGFELAAPGTPRKIGSNSRDQFLGLRFQKQVPSPMTLSVLYAWYAGDHWEVPENPRIAFAGKRNLYKLYVNCDTTGNDGPDADLVAVEFLQALLPVLCGSDSPNS